MPFPKLCTKSFRWDVYMLYKYFYHSCICLWMQCILEGNDKNISCSEIARIYAQTFYILGFLWNFLKCFWDKYVSKLCSSYGNRIYKTNIQIYLCIIQINRKTVLQKFYFTINILTYLFPGWIPTNLRNHKSV